MTGYLVYDVFTDTPLGGNPLAVVLEAEGVAEDRLLPIAREFNLSETVFLYPPAEPGHTARVRIFTPTQEVPFAGHPTIGTAVALSAMLAASEGAPLTLDIAQGVEMGRPSRIGASVTADGAVTISGQAVRVMEGQLLL